MLISKYKVFKDLIMKDFSVLFSKLFKICLNFRCAGDEDQCTDLVNFVQLNIEEATLKDR